MLLANFNRKEHVRHRAVSLRQHGFLVLLTVLLIIQTFKTYKCDVSPVHKNVSQNTHKNDCFYTHTHSTVRAVKPIYLYTLQWKPKKNFSFREPHPANLTVASFEIATTRFLWACSSTRASSLSSDIVLRISVNVRSTFENIRSTAGSAVDTGSIASICSNMTCMFRYTNRGHILSADTAESVTKNRQRTTWTVLLPQQKFVPDYVLAFHLFRPHATVFFLTLQRKTCPCFMFCYDSGRDLWAGWEVHLESLIHFPELHESLQHHSRAG